MEHFGRIYKASEKNREAVLLPIYIQHVQNETVIVRKLALEQFHYISSLSTAEIRSKSLSQIFLSFFTSGSSILPALKEAAAKLVPEFISTFGPGEAPESLVNIFVNADSAFTNESYALNVAKYFPYISRACGWKNVKKTYEALWEGKSEQVIKVLSAGFSDVVAELDQAAVEESIVPIFFKQLLQSKGSVIVVDLLKASTKVLEKASHETKENFIKSLTKIKLASGRVWRIRQVLAENAATYPTFTKSAVLAETIYELVLDLCNDDVWEVRNTIAIHMCKVLEALEITSDFVDTMHLTKLASSQKWQTRQIYIVICKHIWQHVAKIPPEMLDALLSLKDDKVAAIRLIFAQSIVFFGENVNKGNENVKKIAISSSCSKIVKAERAFDWITEEEAGEIDLSPIMEEVEKEQKELAAQKAKPAKIKADELDK